MSNQNNQISLNGTLYTVAALSLKQIKELGPHIKNLSGMTGHPTDEQIDSVVSIVHASLSRNHAALTLEQVSDLVDLGNMAELINRVMGVSGVASASGEATAGN